MSQPSPDPAVAGPGNEDRVPQVPRLWGPGKRQRWLGWVPQVPRLWGPGFQPIWVRLRGPVLILLAAAIATAPILLHKTYCGDDFEFHAIGWFDVQQSWLHGVFYPHWMASANYGAGEPRFIFYPPLTWMLGAALGFVLPWTLVPITMVFLFLAGTGLAVRRLAQERLPDAPATLAGCAAIFSGFALFTAYERTAFAELTGGFWIPLILLFALRDDKAQRVLNGSIIPLALLLTGAWFSNGPVGVMASYLLAAVALGATIWSRSWAPLLRACIASALGIGLAGFSLIPAAWEQRWVDLRAAVDYPVFAVQNNWLFARHTNPLLAPFAMVLHRASWIAVTMIAVSLTCAVIMLWRSRSSRSESPAPRRWWLFLALIPALVLLLQLPISLPLWNLLPKLRFLQYPWRWLLAVEAPMGIFFAAAIWPSNSSKPSRRIAATCLCATLFLATTAFAAKTFLRPCREGDSIADLLTLFHTGGVEGTDEYEPPNADHWLLPKGLPDACLTDDADVVLGTQPDALADGSERSEWAPSQGSCLKTFTAIERSPEHIHLAANVPRAGFLILRLVRYPAWRVTVNGTPAIDLPERDDGLMAVPVPAGPVDLKTEWITTPDVLAGRWLSGLAVASLLLLALFEQKYAAASAMIGTTPNTTESPMLNSVQPNAVEPMKP